MTRRWWAFGVVLVLASWPAGAQPGPDAGPAGDDASEGYVSPFAAEDAADEAGNAADEAGNAAEEAGNAADEDAAGAAPGNEGAPDDGGASEDGDPDDGYVSAFADEDGETDAPPSEGDDESDDDFGYQSPFEDEAGEGPRLDEDGQPIVRLEQVRFDNRVYFKEATIRRFMQHPVPGALDLPLLEEDARTIQGKYKARGYLTAKVTVQLEDGPQPYTKVGVFVIDPGSPVQLRGVDVQGNHLVGAKRLQQNFFSRPPELFGVFTQAGVYHKPSFDQDEQKLLANYYEEGFLEARVAGKRVAATRDLDGLVATIDVVEGPRYELAGLTFAGDIPEGETPATLRDRVSVKDGDVCNLVKIQKESDAVLDLWRNQGYAFARINQQVEMAPPPSGDEDRRGLALILTVDKGQTATVRHINVEGNVGLLYGTFDYVITQELEFDTGDRFSTAALAESQRRLMRLGFFSQVEIKPLPTDEPDKVDVEVRVVEQPTWLLNIAPAYVANEGPILIGIVADRNLIGTGISASLVGTLSFQRQVFDLTVAQPRLLGLPWAISGEAHRRQINYPDFILGSELGGGISSSYRVFWDIFLGGSVTAEYGGVTPYNASSPQYVGRLAPSALLPQQVFRNVVGGYVTLDKRDSILSPRNGVYANVSVDYAGRYTLSGLDVIKAQGNLRLFWSPFWQITFKSQTSVGYAFNPHGGDAPATDRFFLGGFGSVRGYFPRSLTPKANVLLRNGQTRRVSVGGTRMFIQNTEVEFPVFFDTPFRAFAFVDTGNAWSDDEPWFSLLGDGLSRDTPILPLGMFWSVGFGVLFQTPIAPLRFEWSVPLTRRKGDRDLDFFFGVGSAF